MGISSGASAPPLTGKGPREFVCPLEENGDDRVAKQG